MNEYENKRFSVLGDSISTLEGYSEPEYAAFYEGMKMFEADVFSPRDTWWGKVIARLGGSLLVNDSFSGSTVCRHRNHEIPSYASSDERTSHLSLGECRPDVIMVFMGINDWGHGTAPTPEARLHADDPVFSISYGTMLDKLQRNYPDASLWCFTLPVSAWSRNENFVFPYYYAGRHIAEYCEVIRDEAAARGCRVIDLHGNGKPYDTIDGFHPNVYGMQTLAETILGCLQAEAGDTV